MSQLWEELMSGDIESTKQKRAREEHGLHGYMGLTRVSLDRGRHGRVRRVVEKATGQEFAAKFIQVRDAADKEFFRTELEALRRVTHSNVVRLHDAYETPRQLIIVMELYPWQRTNVLGLGA